MQMSSFCATVTPIRVDDELRKLGVKHGDTVRILDYEFEFLIKTYPSRMLLIKKID